jgi:hypothetical protein
VIHFGLVFGEMSREIEGEWVVFVVIAVLKKIIRVRSVIDCIPEFGSRGSLSGFVVGSSDESSAKSRKFPGEFSEILI